MAVVALLAAAAELARGAHERRVAERVEALRLDNLSESDVCLGQAIYFEARGEPYEGQLAVALVVRNRVLDRRFPDDICSVVFQNARQRDACQFSFACDGRSDKPRDRSDWTRALKLARLVNTGQMRDLTENATHYHTLAVSPPWARKLSKTVKIGEHQFYRIP